MLLSPRCSYRSFAVLFAAATLLAGGLPAGADLPTSAVWSKDITTSAPRHPDIDFTRTMAYPIVRVIDSHRIVVLINGREATVRMVGIDTAAGSAELEKPARDRSQAAAQFTANLLRGESVYLEYEPSLGFRDRHSQILAYVFRAPDGLFVDAEIVRQGFGTSHRTTGNRFSNLLHYYETKARQARKGLWGRSLASVPIASKPLHTHTTEKARQQPLVYVMSSGSMYHTAGCPQLNGSPFPMPLYKAITGFDWCPTCKPPR